VSSCLTAHQHKLHTDKDFLTLWQTRISESQCGTLLTQLIECRLFFGTLQYGCLQLCIVVGSILLLF